MSDSELPSSLPTLDPEDWSAFRAQAHAMLDDILNHNASAPSGPVWRPMPPEVRGAFDEPLPEAPTPLETVHERFLRLVLPYATGNGHPRFLGWVHGGGTLVGMLAEMLAAGLNSNLGGRDHAPVEVERQIVRWVRRLFGFPDTASGIIVTGTSMANFMAVLVAKTARLGVETRARGLQGEAARLVAYTSSAAHSCVTRAFELSGLGSEALRLIPCDSEHRMDLAALRAAIARDKAAGAAPFLIVGTAGTVGTGATDDLAALADIAAAEGLWLHVDGAFGSLAVLSPELRPKVAGIEQADSLAFDFHKWLQVPYDAGFLLVRDGARHRAAFESSADYLVRTDRGLAAGSPWFTDFGPDLSRGFRALKVWFTFKVFGTERLGAMIAETCRLAQHLARRVLREPELELLAPTPLNIVCFRYRHPDADAVNRAIVIDLQESGVTAPSTTRVGGALAIRVAIVNHRCRAPDLDLLVDEVLRRGRTYAAAP
jgi:glutamate/tyrosine decarboxylase-like PLP-dependent enzyme